VQHDMDEGDGDRSFAHRRSDALDVSAAHVADGEDAGKAGLEKVRRPDERPMRGGELLG
jgi:hypothetical protein